MRCRRGSPRRSARSPVGERATVERSCVGVLSPRAGDRASSGGSACSARAMAVVTRGGESGLVLPSFILTLGLGLGLGLGFRVGVDLLGKSSPLLLFSCSDLLQELDLRLVRRSDTVDRLDRITSHRSSM